MAKKSKDKEEPRLMGAEDSDNPMLEDGGTGYPHPVEQEHSECEAGDAGQWEFLRPERKQVRMPVTLERGHELVEELVRCRNLKTNLEAELEDCKKMVKGLKEQIAYQEQKIGININILGEGEFQMVDVEVFGDFGARMVEVRDADGEVLESRAMTATELQRELPLEGEDDDQEVDKDHIDGAGPDEGVCVECGADFADFTNDDGCSICAECHDIDTEEDAA